MKLGILNACTPKEEADFAQSEFGNFQNFFRQADPTISLTEYRITEGDFPEAIDDYHAFLITGSPKGAYDDDRWIAETGDFIRLCHSQQKKLVGICFGHQLLAHSLGGHVEKSAKGWGMGRQQVEVTSPQPWMQPPLPQAAFYFCHQDQVVELPDEAERLAGNSFCPNGMFMIGDNVLGIQAHPEFTQDVMRKVFRWFRPRMDADWIDAVEATTVGNGSDKEVHNLIMGQWIVNFLVGQQ